MFFEDEIFFSNLYANESNFHQTSLKTLTKIRKLDYKLFYQTHIIQLSSENVSTVRFGTSAICFLKK